VALTSKFDLVQILSKNSVAEARAGCGAERAVLRAPELPRLRARSEGPPGGPPRAHRPGIWTSVGPQLRSIRVATAVLWSP